MGAGLAFADACARVSRGFVFTTHTPVAAGNETYSPEEMRAVFPETIVSHQVTNSSSTGRGASSAGTRTSGPSPGTRKNSFAAASR